MGGCPSTEGPSCGNLETTSNSKSNYEGQKASECSERQRTVLLISQAAYFLDCRYSHEMKLDSFEILVSLHTRCGEKLDLVAQKCCQKIDYQPSSGSRGAEGGIPPTL